MAKKTDKHVDNLLDALVWMRRKAKRRQPVDDLVDALLKMRRKAKKKVTQRKKTTKMRVKSESYRDLHDQHFSVVNFSSCDVSA
jgi:hypothetical protein